VPELRFSKSDDPETHGRKLYTVFAKELHWSALDASGRPLFARRKSYLPFVTKVDPVTGEKTLLPGPAPVGQILVKEAWNFREISAEDYRKAVANNQEAERQQTRVVRESNDVQGLGATTFDHGSQLRPYAVRYAQTSKEHRYYQGTTVAGLFIMTKLDPQTPRTDNGWIYGTVDADLKTVTSVGKVASCMKCHRDAPYDRLFGLP
jgi:hypothetical protein